MTTCIQALNRSLHRMLQDDERVYLLGEDIRDPYGGAFKVTKGLSTQFDDRVLNTPISEAAITGVGVGMALQGLRPVVEIMFGDFATLAADQLINNAAKLSWMYNDKVRVPLVVRMPMGGRRGYGPTHSQCMERLFCGVPGLKVIAPSIYHDVGQLLRTAVLDDDGPVVFVECKTDYGKHLAEEQDGMIGDWFLRSSAGRHSRFTPRASTAGPCREGHLYACQGSRPRAVPIYSNAVTPLRRPGHTSTNDTDLPQSGCTASYPTVRLSMTAFEDDQVTVVCYGGMTTLAVQAAEELMYDRDIAVEVVIPSGIWPMELSAVTASLARTRRLVVVEEGHLHHGWSAELISQVTSSCTDNDTAPHDDSQQPTCHAAVRVGAGNRPIGNARNLEGQVLPGVEDIKAAVMSALSKRHPVGALAGNM